MIRAAALHPVPTGTLLLLALWALLARGLAGQQLIAGPVEVIGWSIDNAGVLLRALAATLQNAAAGFLAGNLAALLLAFVAVIWPRLQSLVAGLALVVFCLPLVATGPILRIVMGPGNGPQIALAALAVYYTTLIPVLTGMRAVPGTWLDLVNVHGRGRLAELIHIRARAALPYIFAGLQIAAPAAFLGAMVGEFTGAERGLGVLTIRFMRGLDPAALWAIAALAALVSMAAYGAIGLVARIVLAEPTPAMLATPAAQGKATGARLGSLALLLALIVALWWVAMAALDLSPFFAKRPAEVLAALTWDAGAPQLRATLLTALSETAVYLVPGYLAGLALGAGIAALLSVRPGLSALIMPAALALRAIPIVTTAPLIVLLLGRGAGGTITLVAVMVFFPTLVACLYGLRQAPAPVLDLFHVYAAGALRRLRLVRIPAMLPAFFAAARMSVPAAVLAVTVVEWLTTGRGLGSLMALSASVSDYTTLWAAVVVVTALSVASHAAVAAIETRVLAVYAPEQLRR